MRIIAGRYKGRQLEAVSGLQTRPTTSRVREAWASSLLSVMPQGSLEGACVLDPFAGSGALGLELLSRGANACVFVEQHKAAAAILKANIAALGLEATQARVYMANSLSPQLLSLLKGAAPFDVAVLDPPYALPLRKVKELLATLGHAGLLVNQSVVSYEHAATQTEDMNNFLLCKTCTTTALSLVKRKIYGTICMDYYVCQ